MTFDEWLAKPHQGERRRKSEEVLEQQPSTVSLITAIPVPATVLAVRCMQDKELEKVESLIERVAQDLEALSKLTSQVILDAPDKLNQLTAQKVAAGLAQQPKRSIGSRLALVTAILKAVRNPEDLPVIEQSLMLQAIDRGAVDAPVVEPEAPAFVLPAGPTEVPDYLFDMLDPEFIAANNMVRRVTFAPVTDKSKVIGRSFFDEMTPEYIAENQLIRYDPENPYHQFTYGA